MGVGAIALTILTAPLAILAPLYPPAIQLAALPFMSVDPTFKAVRDAELLQQEAAKARLDSACDEQLAAAHPELAEKLQRTLSGEALRQLIALLGLQRIVDHRFFWGSQFIFDISQQRDKIFNGADASKNVRVSTPLNQFF